MMANQASNHLVGGIVPLRMGNAHLNVVPYQVFSTQDGHCVIAIGNDGQFSRFCELAGHPDVAQDPRFVGNSARLAHRDSLIPLMQTWLLERSTQGWIDLLEPHAVPCAPILNLPGVFAHHQVVARGMQAGLDVGADRPMPMVPNPMRFDGQRAMAERPPPGLDADGDALRLALRQGKGWPAR